MVDLNRFSSSVDLQFTTDASVNPKFGIGAIFGHRWLFTQWEPGFIKKYKPSIKYLELYGVIAAILSWLNELKNIRMLLHCDNSAVVGMLNSLASSCKNCMYLLRLLTLNNLVHNRRVFTLHISSEDNFLSDSLSRLQFKRFWKLAPKGMNRQPSIISPLIWPVSKIWQEFKQ